MEKQFPKERMEKYAPDLPAPTDIPIVEGQEEYVVNNCSAHPTEHRPATEQQEACDGNCGTEVISLGAALIHNELHAWQRAGMTTQMVPHDVFNIDVQLLTVIRMMEDKGICTEAEFNVLYRELVLEKMQTVREKNEAIVRTARSKAETAEKLAIAQGQIFDANGRIIPRNDNFRLN